MIELKDNLDFRNLVYWHRPTWKLLQRKKEENLLLLFIN